MNRHINEVNVAVTGLLQHLENTLVSYNKKPADWNFEVQRDLILKGYNAGGNARKFVGLIENGLVKDMEIFCQGIVNEPTQEKLDNFLKVFKEKTEFMKQNKGNPNSWTDENFQKFKSERERIVLEGAIQGEGT